MFSNCFPTVKYGREGSLQFSVIKLQDCRRNAEWTFNADGLNILFNLFYKGWNRLTISSEGFKPQHSTRPHGSFGNNLVSTYNINRSPHSVIANYGPLRTENRPNRVNTTMNDRRFPQPDRGSTTAAIWIQELTTHYSTCNHTCFAAWARYIQQESQVNHHCVCLKHEY